MNAFASLEETSLFDLHAAFVDAFSEYEVPINLSTEALNEMLETRSYKPEYSYGYFVDERLVSFILVGVRTRKGIVTAYDTGTGTIKAYQGKGMGSKLLDEVIGRLKERGVQRFVLEVLENNKPAQSLYGRYGFEISRTLNCYRRDRTNVSREDVAENPSVAETFGDRVDLITFQPSWQNEMESYRNSQDRYIVVDGGGIEGLFGIVHRKNGSILQVGLGVGNTGLEQEAQLFRLLENSTDGQGLKYLNVEKGSRIEEILVRNGFELYISQYEMALDM